VVAPDFAPRGLQRTAWLNPKMFTARSLAIRRLQQAAVHVQGAAPQVVAESLMNAAEEWAGTPETSRRH